jgi:cystathionine beta-lyase
MRYDFDREIDRRGTCATKWEFIQREDTALELERTDRFFGEGRTLPMWVADMDFPCPQPVIEALVTRATHGIYGYSSPSEAYIQSVIQWMKRRQGWEIAPESICIAPGVVPALCMLVQAFTHPGEGVLIQPPVYYPFAAAIERNGAHVVRNPLILEGGQYRMDFEDLERKAADPQVKMAILCSPHNPVGRVWEAEELRRFAEICRANDVLIISDEIHGDLIYPGRTFTPFAALGKALAEQAVICTAPSKTFNLAGLHMSNIIVPDPRLRQRFQQALLKNGLTGVNPFGLAACTAAYDEGEDWLEQVLEYLDGNLTALRQHLRHHVPQITLIEPQGTYLAWLDCRQLGLSRPALHRLMLERARVYLDEGHIFGEDGEGFERMNIACPRPVLREALDRIQQAVHSR